jgi:hypothetical protein
LLIGLQTTFREKLEWLEEAETLTLRMRGVQDAPPSSDNLPEKPSSEIGRS